MKMQPKYVRRRVFLASGVLVIAAIVLIQAGVWSWETQDEQTLQENAVYWFPWGILGLMFIASGFAAIVAAGLLIKNMPSKKPAGRTEEGRVYSMPVNRSHGGRG